MISGIILQSLLSVAVLAQNGRYEKIHNVLEAKCVYTTMSSLAETSFTIQFDRPTITLTSNDVSVVNKVGNGYHVRSVGNIVPTNGQWTARINVWYNSTDEPQGTCMSLQAPPQTTTVATTTFTGSPTQTSTTATTTVTVSPTQTSPCQGILPFCFPAQILRHWNVQRGIRFEARCKFRVSQTSTPHTKSLGLKFDKKIYNFETWVMNKLSPDEKYGTLFMFDNMHWIHPDNLEANFQATVKDDSLPTVYCLGELPTYDVVTTAQPPTTTNPPTTQTTTNPSTTQTTTNPPTTQTTTNPPTTQTTTNPPTTAPPTTNPPTTQSTTNPQTTETTTNPPTTQPTTTISSSTQPATSSPNWPYNYNEVIQKSIWFYRAQRSGDLPEVANDPVPWRGDSALYDGEDVGLDLTGGWYDAGDWVKFNFPISAATAVLAWGIVQWEDGYRAAGQYEQALDSIKWSLDFFLKCWKPDQNLLYGQVGNGNEDHSKMMRPEDMTRGNMWRPAYSVTSNQGGSDLAGTMVAAFAAGAIAFQQDADYSAELLSAAESLYVFADTYRALYTGEIGDAGGFYPSSGYNDELVYAAAMLYKATGDPYYLNDAETKYNQFGFAGQTSWAFDWSDKLMGAKLLLFEATGNAQYSNDVTAFLNEWSPGQFQYTPGGLAYRGPWGALRYSANTAFIALMAADIGINPSSNHNWAMGQIHYMLGDNPRQSSYVVGFGNNPPRRPHHKSSTCEAPPALCDWGVFSADTENAFTLYGALVGGPDMGDNYNDDRTDYIMAEVTCDYNAGFQSAVAALIHFGL